LPGNLFLNGWTNWDGQWYARIATQGYTGVAIDGSGQRDVGQLPLYPMTVRAASWVIGDVHIAGLLVSNIAFVLAGLVLFRLVESQFDSTVARRTLVLWCVWPFSYVFSAMYTESLFMLCVVGAFALGTQRLAGAALCAAGASLTRTVGVATALALLTLWAQRERFQTAALRRDAGWLLVAFSGIGLFMLILGLRFGDPLAFVRAHAAAGWGDFNSLSELRDVIRQWRSATSGNVASGNVPLLHTLHVLTMLLAAGLCLVGLRRLPLAWSVWAILMVVMSYYRWACFGRHFSTIWPAFVVAALLLRDAPNLYRGVVYFCTALLVLLTLLFTQGYWVA
jgi:hypothetical protein